MALQVFKIGQIVEPADAVYCGREEIKGLAGLLIKVENQKILVSWFKTKFYGSYTEWWNSDLLKIISDVGIVNETEI